MSHKEIIAFGPGRLDPKRRAFTLAGQKIDITEMEFNLLEAILQLAVEAKGAIQKQAVRDTLWPKKEISSNAVDTHFGNLKRKCKTVDLPIQSKGSYFSVDFEAHRTVQEPPSETNMRGLTRSEIPYVGPVPFSPDKQKFFFGRHNEVSLLVDLLTVEARRVVLLFGPSGAGKTSLVNTALAEALRKLDYFVFPVARVGVGPQAPQTDDPPNCFVLSILRSLQVNTEAATFNPSHSLEDYLNSAAEPGKKGAVLILDQLEEILSPVRYSQRTGFFAELHTTIARNPSLRVILVFREEFLGPLRRLAGELSHYSHEFLLRQLDRTMASLAIKNPADAVGVMFEDRFLEMLVNELSRGKHALYDGTIVEDRTDNVEPLHLQLICQALWSRLPEGLVAITFDNVEPILRDADSPRSPLLANPSAETLVADFVSLVLQRFCDDAIERAVATEQANGNGKIPLELVVLGCLQFITERRTRTPPVGQGVWCTGDLPNSVIEELGRQHVLRAEKHGTERTWELSHDAWIQPLLRRAGRIDTNALQLLYIRVVKEISKATEARDTGLDEATIQLGCLAFLAGQPDRLPLFLLNALAKEGLLRRKPIPQGVEFELSNPSLRSAIEEVGLQGDLDTRLTALKGLSVFVKGTLQQHKGSLKDWFGNHDSVLRTLNSDLAWPFLYENEAEFILRASFKTGLAHGHWLKQMAQRYPAMAATVLEEAANDGSDKHVRLRAAENLVLLESVKRNELLVKLAIFDPEVSVRQAAAAGLANPDQIACWNKIVDHCHGATRIRAINSLAWAWEIRIRTGRQEEFETWLRDRPIRVRFEAYLARTKIRLGACFGRLAILCFLSAVACGVITAITRTVPGRLIGTLTQNAGQFGFHWFNGLIGGFVWGASIAAVLLAWCYVFIGSKSIQSNSPRRVVAAASGVGGLLGGLINTFIMLEGVSQNWLYKAGWLQTSESPLLEAFTVSRFGLGYIVFGIMLGIGVGCSFLSIQKSRRYDGVYDRAAPERFENLPLLGWRTLQLCFGRSAWIACSMVIAASVFASILHPTDVRSFALSGDPMFWRILGEAVSVYFGGLGVITGLYFGIVLLKNGVVIEGRDDFSMPMARVDENSV